MSQGDPQLIAVLDEIGSLVGSWCERRSLKPLSYILQGYPLTSPLTDGWGLLLLALQNVRAFAKAELTEAEIDRVNKVIARVDRIITGR